MDKKLEEVRLYFATHATAAGKESDVLMGPRYNRSESICLVDKGGSKDGTYITLLHHIKMND